MDTRSDEDGKAGGVTILVAEDNEQIRKLTAIILASKGYSVLCAEDGLSALDLLLSSPDPVHLLLTDLIMPQMNGRDLYGRAREIYEDIKVIYMSGYTSDILQEQNEIHRDAHFVQKPFTIDSLIGMVKTALAE